MNGPSPYADALARALHFPAPMAEIHGQAGLVKKARDRIWELPATYHCSIIGTCLTTNDLRQLLIKLGESDARAASDHRVHSLGVTIASRMDNGGKLLQKLLDRKHERDIKRFAMAQTSEDVRSMWREALDRGDIPGAYWAALSHPATDRSLVQEVFGEVHMLSHLVGQSNRADIRRLRQLEAELERAADKNSRQEARIRLAAAERLVLQRQLAAAGQRLTEQERPRAVAADAALARELDALRERMARQLAHNESLQRRLKSLETANESLRQDNKTLRLRDADLRREADALEAALLPCAAGADDQHAQFDLAGMTLLYVGGRPRQVGQLRSLTQRYGGVLLTHDGGLEDSFSLLPGLASQADHILFPVDCVSHAAMGLAKRLCHDAGKTYVPLRSASVASFLAALGNLAIKAIEPGQKRGEACACCEPAKS